MVLGLSNFSELVHDKYVNVVFQEYLREFSFEETAKELFGVRNSLSSKRCMCFPPYKNVADDFLPYVGTVSTYCEDFDLINITTDQFKNLTLSVAYDHGRTLTSLRDSFPNRKVPDIHRRISSHPAVEHRVSHHDQIKEAMGEEARSTIANTHHTNANVYTVTNSHANSPLCCTLIQITCNEAT